MESSIGFADLIQDYSTDFQFTSRRLLKDFNIDQFNIVNAHMAINVAPKSAFLFVASLDKAMQAEEVTEIFDAFCLKCGAGFENARRGSPEYNEAKNAVGGIVLEFLPEVLKVLNNDTDINNLLGKIDIRDVARSLDDVPGGNLNNMDMDSVRLSLRKTVDMGDTFIDTVNELGADKKQLTSKENEALKAIVALAQAGYIHTQLFRAKEEGVGRFDRAQFNIAPVMRKLIYKEAENVGGVNRDDCKLRVAFEVLKDVIEVKKALPNNFNFANAQKN